MAYPGIHARVRRRRSGADGFSVDDVHQFPTVIGAAVGRAGGRASFTRCHVEEAMARDNARAAAAAVARRVV